jgi:hypothetical protein
VRVHGSILHLGELVALLEGCEKLHDTLQGQARLSCMEPDLALVMSASDGLGHLEAEVRITPDHLKQEHLFRLTLDQSYLPGIIQSLRGVIERYPVRGSDEERRHNTRVQPDAAIEGDRGEYD